MKFSLAAGLALLLAASSMGTASAHSPSDPEMAGNIGRLSAAANLIFRGKVTQVKYRNSAAGRNGSPGIPYTFVTFSVLDVLQGASPGRSITLRFIGGADGRGGFVEAEGVPTFQVGDEDVLFVVGNGETGCPLVLCEFGRFRILNEVMHRAHGTPVVSLDEGRIRAEGQAPAAFSTVRYPAPEFDEVLKRPEFAEAMRAAGMTVAQARRWYEAEAPDFIEMRAAEVQTEAARRANAAAPEPVGVEPFLSVVRSASARSGRRALQAIRSIDPNAPIAAPESVASAPPATPLGPAENLSPGSIIRKN